MPDYVATNENPAVGKQFFSLPDGVEPSPEYARAGWTVELAPEPAEDAPEAPAETADTALDLSAPETPSDDGEQAPDPLNPTKEN